MADRLRFYAIRLVKKTQSIELAIDVNDPTDAEEIANKLTSKDFVEFVVLDEEIMEDDNWSFQPKPLT